MTVKLVDIFNTKYFYITFRKDLSYLVNCVNKVREDQSLQLHAPSEKFAEVLRSVAAGEELTIDIAGARFTPDTEPMLHSMISADITLTDTELNWRRTLLEENVLRNGLRSTNSIPLPDFTYTTNIKEYIHELRTDVMYSRNALDNYVQLALVTLITVTRPSVTLSGDFFELGLFDYVNSRLSVTDIEKYDKFIMRSEEGVRVVDFSNNGTVFIQGLGYVDYIDAVSKVSFIPAVFGTVTLLRDDAFSSLIHDAFMIIQQYQQSRPKMLYEVLPLNKEIINDY